MYMRANHLGGDATVGVEVLRRHVVDADDLREEVGSPRDGAQPVADLLERRALGDDRANERRVLVAHERLPLAAELLAGVRAPVELARDLAADRAHLPLTHVAPLLVDLEQSRCHDGVAQHDAAES